MNDVRSATRSIHGIFKQGENEMDHVSIASYNTHRSSMSSGSAPPVAMPHLGNHFSESGKIESQLASHISGIGGSGEYRSAHGSNENNASMQIEMHSLPRQPTNLEGKFTATGPNELTRPGTLRSEGDIVETTTGYTPGAETLGNPTTPQAMAVSRSLMSEQNEDGFGEEPGETHQVDQ